MYLIGLTGGIASGKSTIARRLVEHGAVHIDADQLARKVVAPGTEGLAQIREAFGDGVLAADGTLDRAALGELVFSDAAALERLNAIVHPQVRALSSRLFAAAEAANPRAVVVYDVPLLVEAEVDHPFDLIVVAHATKQTRADRLVELRGLSEEHAQARIDAQASDTQRLAIADVVVDTDGTMGHTVSQTDALWARVREELAARS
ncbi:dephospho-CoA kinase [Leifsonia sp. Leaf264]|uniref:dephospho-CoA kinase n=1 Tax=Leifsonia sp. Leaf264 TaxID=1736314 RepID=UPI000701674E|nr:dephospho-CoA kinase [Leifsonia sp. Leaf264]KQO99872.1 dephospho-CoA kinase [Leifsonia sp. Leaf264]